MSNENNTVFLESANQNFEEALESKDFTAAQDIMGDVENMGFKTEYHDMTKRYNAAKDQEKELIDEQN